MSNTNQNEIECIKVGVFGKMEVGKEAFLLKLINGIYIENLEKQDAVKEYENQIDIMVYKLYDLTYSEVKTIDPNFSMPELEYNNYTI